MRTAFAVLTILACTSSVTQACDPVPRQREPTLPEMIGGLEQIFGGTVVGYRLSDGTDLVGPMPQQCLDDDDSYLWYRKDAPAICTKYIDTEGALFRVDTPIVGPGLGEIASDYMTWGDGDCNTDYRIGDQWLIAGKFSQKLRAPIRENEVAILQRLAAKPKFDFNELYRRQPEKSADE